MPGFRINTADNGKYTFQVAECKNNKCNNVQATPKESLAFSDLLANVTKSISNVTLDQVQTNPSPIELTSTSYVQMETFFYTLKNNKPVLRRATLSNTNMIKTAIAGLDINNYNVYKAYSCYKEQKYKINMYELFKSYLASNSLLPLPIHKIPDKFNVDFPLLIWFKLSYDPSNIVCKHYWFLAKPTQATSITPKQTFKRPLNALYANASSQEDLTNGSSQDDFGNDSSQDELNDMSPFKRVKRGGKHVKIYKVMKDTMGVKFIKVNKAKVKLTDIKGSYRYTTPLQTHIKLLTSRK